MTTTELKEYLFDVFSELTKTNYEIMLGNPKHLGRLIGDELPIKLTEANIQIAKANIRQQIKGSTTRLIIVVQDHPYLNIVCTVNHKKYDTNKEIVIQAMTIGVTGFTFVVEYSVTDGSKTAQAFMLELANKVNKFREELKNKYRDDIIRIVVNACKELEEEAEKTVDTCTYVERYRSCKYVMPFELNEWLVKNNIPRSCRFGVEEDLDDTSISEPCVTYKEVIPLSTAEYKRNVKNYVNSKIHRKISDALKAEGYECTITSFHSVALHECLKGDPNSYLFDKIYAYPNVYKL